MLKKLKAFLSDPSWQGIGAIGTILALTVTLVVIFRKDIFNIFPYISIIIKKGFGTPLGQFSAILFLISLFWIFLFRHDVSKFKGVLLFLGLAGFIVSGLIPINYRMPEDATPMITELRKEKEALQRELVTSKETIQQKENENALIKREKEKLGKEVEIQKNQSKAYGDTIQQKENENAFVKQEKEKLVKEVETQKQQNKTYGDMIAQKDKEISNLNRQLTDLSSEAKELRSKVSLLEKQYRESQVEISNLKKSTAIPQVRFEYADKKLFLIDGEKRKQILTTYSINEYSKSKNGKKIAAIATKPDHRYYLIVFNADGELSDSSVWEIKDHSLEGPKNLKWVSDTVLRVYLSQRSPPSGFAVLLQFEDVILFSGTGNYEITIDEFNCLVSINKLKI
jgi:hypothetical protein